MEGTFQIDGFKCPKCKRKYFPNFQGQQYPITRCIFCGYIYGSDDYIMR